MPLGTMRWTVEVRRSGGGIAWEATPPVLALSGKMIRGYRKPCGEESKWE